MEVCPYKRHSLHPYRCDQPLDTIFLPFYSSAASARLPRGVMVAQLTLDQFV